MLLSLPEYYHLHQPVALAPQEFYHQLNPLIDVRSEKEYVEGTILEAINLALFDNSQRDKIGTFYKKVGKKEAVDLGYSFVKYKLGAIAKFFSQFSADQKIYIFCARGGFRSAAVCKILTQWGYQPVQLAGGYKAYRQWSSDFFEQLKFTKGLFMIHGKTGVGKTHFLKTLPNHIDLEGAAQHRGSVFGDIGLAPHSQKNFEAKLIQQLQSLDYNKPVFIEGESSKLGSVFIPKTLWHQMKAAHKILAITDFHLRIERLYTEYINDSLKIIDRIMKHYERLTNVLSTHLVDDVLQMLKDRQPKEAIKKLCLDYYDIKYAHSHKQVKFIFEVDIADFSLARQRLLDFATTYLS